MLYSLKCGFFFVVIVISNNIDYCFLFCFYFVLGVVKILCYLIFIVIL